MTEKDANIEEQKVDYLNLEYLIRFLLNNWKNLIFSSFISGVLAVSYSLTLDDFYTSSAKFTSANTMQSNTQSTGGLSGLASGFGLNLNQGSNRIDYAVEILKSSDFFKSLYMNESFLIELAAVNDYDKASNKLFINEDIFDKNRNVWLEDLSSFTKTTKPSLLEAKNKFFSEHIGLSVDIKTSYLSISITHASPYIAQSWLNYVLDEINTYIQFMEVGEIEQSIEYLKGQLEETNKTDVRKALSNILEQQIKTLMLSEVSSGYMLKTIDSASFPEIKSGPIRSKICISLTLAGFSLAFLFLLLRDLNRERLLLVFN